MWKSAEVSLLLILLLISIMFYHCPFSDQVFQYVWILPFQKRMKLMMVHVAFMERSSRLFKWTKCHELKCYTSLSLWLRCNVAMILQDFFQSPAPQIRRWLWLWVDIKQPQHCLVGKSKCTCLCLIENNISNFQGNGLFEKKISWAFAMQVRCILYNVTVFSILHLL